MTTEPESELTESDRAVVTLNLSQARLNNALAAEAEMRAREIEQRLGA